MSEYYQDIKIICQNHVMKGSLKASEGHPWRNWKIRVVAIDNHREKKGKLNLLLDHVEYMLHPTFENPRRVFSKEPYLLQEKGWGEFDMRVVLYFTNHLSEPENIFFDLHFREHTYAILHRVHFRQPSPELIRILTTEPEPFYTQQYQQSESKKRRTSPPLTTSKKVKTPPANIGSPAHESSPYNRYPASPSQYDESDDVLRAIHGNRIHQQQQQQLKDGVVIDHVYNEKDVDNVHMIHKRGLEDHVRKIWGVPKGLDMLELARRLSSRPPEEMTEIETLILNHRREDMILEDNEDEFVVDLYSLGPDLLNRLWQYTENKLRTKNRTEMSPFSLVEANTNMVDYD